MKILFTVCGVGLGHAVRSSVLIKELAKEHEVFVTSYGQGYDYLKGTILGNGKVAAQQLQWFELKFDESRFLKAQTFLQNISKLPSVAASNFVKMVKFVRAFEPDVIISDFDVNGVYVGLLFNIPVITISNMHLMKYAKPSLRLKEKIGYYLTERPILDMFAGTKHFLIPGLVKPHTNEKNVHFFHPLFRGAVLKLKPRKGKHFLAYGSDAMVDSIIALLPLFPDKQFIVYGKNKTAKKGNVHFKRFSEEGFLNDLAGCQAVLCHGGTTLISEALLLGKPVYISTPIDFFERYFNGLLVQGLGCGEIYPEPTKETLYWFLGHVDGYARAIRKLKLRPGNPALLRELNKILEQEKQKGKWPQRIPETLKEIRERLKEKYQQLNQQLLHG